MLSIVERAAGFGDEPAVEDAEGSHSYADLLEVSLSMAGVLLAPQSGEKTRKQLKDLAGEVGNSMGQLASDAKDTVQNLAEKSKQLVGQR